MVATGDGNPLVVRVVPVLLTDAGVAGPDLHRDVVMRVRPRVKAEVGASELDRWVLSRRDVPLAESSGGAARNRLDKGPIDDRGVGDCQTLVGIVVVRNLNPRGTLGWSGRSEQRQQGDEGEL